MVDFTHLHLHTQYSILDGACNIPLLMAKAKENGMRAIAITDHGNLFGALEFYNEARRNGLKPILGCEAYMAKRSRHEMKTKEDRAGYHLILLAKNLRGYHNLIKLISLSWIEGHYYKPRIDKELLEKYHEGIIVSTACLGGEIPQAIIHDNEEDLHEAIKFFKGLFGDDFYLELQRHETGNPEMDQDTFAKQKKVNARLLESSEEYGLKCIATNDVHFINEIDAEAHDRLICLNTGKDLDDPDRMRYTKQEWFKTREEMSAVFSDLPGVLENTAEIVEKIEDYSLKRKPILPVFPLPEGFANENEYLRHLTHEGAKKRYPEITPEIKERVDFELGVVERMGFPGYFLIVQDFLQAARDLGVSVGPGRGSAAGSVVAYCTRITDIDPLKYNLLFERFLNPDRISLPDIDIDFDEDGRDQVLKYVVKKYGESKVAQIITFGTMAARMAIRDVARIEKLPLPDADKLAKLVPERPGITLRKAYEEVPELKLARKSRDDLVRKTLQFAETLEGSVRHTGLHACGIIIGREELIEHIPVCRSKDTDLLVTQYEGVQVEDVGMLKMDFLGLKTLSIIKDASRMIAATRGTEIDPTRLPLDDAKTFSLYSKGETTAIFQFESPGMKRYLRELKPNRFEDLIAMNALYRPGPMEYIPKFIRRKHGKEKIAYDFPIMEEYLEETYGITVYQEQVMRLSQAMAGFTGGQADSLRKAMGKKKRKMMDELKEKFLEGCEKNNITKRMAMKVWTDWEAFAQYAFNKSHSTCYAFVSYQTAYLKANYPAEFMAAVLSRNITDIKKITVFMHECRRMGLSVLGPDINESQVRFTVNKKGDIRFGMGAIKGVGESAVSMIIREREENGPFRDIFDFVERVDLHAVNKKSIEALAAGGAFDCFEAPERGQYFTEDERGNNFIESLVRYGSSVQSEKNNKQQSLFGQVEDNGYKRPVLPNGADWPKLEKLKQEKELIGIYLSAHPLDNYKIDMEQLCSHTLSDMGDLNELMGKEISIAGIVVEARHAFTKNNKPYGTMVLEDFTDSHRLALFGRDYISFKNFLTEGYTIWLKGQVQKRAFGRSPDEPEIKVKQIHMLTDIREELIKSVQLKIKLNDLNEEIINEISKFTGNAKGKALLKFEIYDREDQLNIGMFSRSQRLDITDQFLNYLSTHEELEFKFN